MKNDEAMTICSVYDNAKTNDCHVIIKEMIYSYFPATSVDGALESKF